MKFLLPILFLFSLSALADNTSYFCSSHNEVGRIDYLGTSSVSQNNFKILGSSLCPGGFTQIICGDQKDCAPFGNGFRCVGGNVCRVGPPIFVDSSGNMGQFLNLPGTHQQYGVPSAIPGATVNFQLMYRVPDGTGIDFSNAFQITFTL